MACRIVVALLLLMAARPHLANGYQFLESVLAYRLLPNELAVVVAVIVPSLELTLGVALVFVPRLRRMACDVSVVLFTLFLIAQSSAYARGLDIGCGCFGDAEDRIGWRSIATATVGLLLALSGRIGTRHD